MESRNDHWRSYVLPVTMSRLLHELAQVTDEGRKAGRKSVTVDLMNYLPVRYLPTGSEIRELQEVLAMWCKARKLYYMFGKDNCNWTQASIMFSPVSRAFFLV